MLQTKTHVVVEQFNDTDRAEIHAIIETLRQSYKERLHQATLDYHRAQREVNRASHEMTRLERHLERIDGFITKHTIAMEEK